MAEAVVRTAPPGAPIVGQAVPRPPAGGAPASAFTPSANFGSLAHGAAGYGGSLGDPTIDPGFEWRRNQGQKGLERAAAAKGTLMTGGSLGDIMDYNQGLASQEYANAWDRAYRKWMGEANIAQGNASIENQNRATSIGAYQGLINTGLNAANNYTGYMTNAASGGANAQAGAQAGAGRAWGDVARDAGDAAGTAWMWNYDRFGNAQALANPATNFASAAPVAAAPGPLTLSSNSNYVAPVPERWGQ